MIYQLVEVVSGTVKISGRLSDLPFLYQIRDAQQQNALRQGHSLSERRFAVRLMR